MTRAQCIVHRGNKLLMVRHRLQGVAWWCLPGGGVEPGETPAQAALRELREECCVEGKIVREINYLRFIIDDMEDDAYTYLVDIGDQEPRMGGDPEFPQEVQVIVDIAWLALDEICERDRAYLWGAGLLGIPAFMEQVDAWGDEVSYPGTGE